MATKRSKAQTGKPKSIRTANGGRAGRAAKSPRRTTRATGSGSGAKGEQTVLMEALSASIAIAGGRPPVQVSHRTLKNQQGQVFREIAATGDTVLVTNRERVDGVLLSPDAFATLRGAAAAGERLLAALPLLMGAARSGVAVPSEAAETLGFGLAEDWRALNELLSAIPVALSHGEDGEPLPGERPPLHAERVSEDDEELLFSS